MLLLLVHLYIVTMDILHQVIHTGMSTASGALGNVNKSNFMHRKRRELEDVAAISEIF